MALRTVSPHRHPQLPDFQDGRRGIILSGGDRKTLASSENVVSGCTFYQTDQINFTYSAAVKLFGVGATIERCAFSDLKHMAINFTGNDHVIRLNRFEWVCTWTDDMGAVYTGRDPSARGTVIRHNYFRHIQPVDTESQVCGVFIDDGAGGITVDSNYFERVGCQGDKELFGAVFLHGGHDNIVSHNVFQDCEIAIGNNFWTEKQWRIFLESPLMQQRLRQNADIGSPVYLAKYPELKDYFTAYGPRLNRIVENILIRSNMALNGRLELVFNHLYAPENLEKALERIGLQSNCVGPEN
ncbi:MAG: right-handed parallel beta-helix repeat-containing protein [Saprospirales bacterium]|nr:right-handed parallel beta-helix repeat-containing protein [Saprospirales bacterium]